MRELVDSLLDFIFEVAFRLAGHYGQSEGDVLSRPAGWFLDRWERYLRLHYQDMTAQVAAVQAGVSRALAQALGGKKRLPSLPSYDEARKDIEARALERDDPTAHFWWLRPPKPKGEEDGKAEEAAGAGQAGRD